MRRHLHMWWCGSLHTVPLDPDLHRQNKNKKWTFVTVFLFCFVFVRVQELCESRGGRPGISVLMSLTVSVDVKQHWTMLRHWSQFVLNTSTDIRGHEALHHYIVFWRQCSGRLKKQTNKTKQKPRRRWSNVITHNLTTVEHNSNPHIQYSNNCDSHYTCLLYTSDAADER